MLFNNKAVAIKAAIESLEEWATSGAPSLAIGVCTNLDIAIKCKDIDWYFVVGCAARSWPYYSGNPAYPVPLIGYSTPGEAFEEAGLWKGVYGELRRDLCKHVANYLKEGVNTHVRRPHPGDKVWCNIEGVRREGKVLSVSEKAYYGCHFWTSCDGGRCAIYAHTANKEWGFIE